MEKENLLLVTEHYPCGERERFLETEIDFLAQKYHVIIFSTYTDHMMTRSIPKGVTFLRPAERRSPFLRKLSRLLCRFSQGYRDEKREAKIEARWSKEFQEETLTALVESREIYDYIKEQNFFEEDQKLVIYSASLNRYFYGLCALKEFYPEGIKVVARCHGANMMDPRTGKRRNTLNYVINQVADEIYFATKERRDAYLEHFMGATGDPRKYKVAPFGVYPGEESRALPPTEYFLRMVSCCPIEDDKRLTLIADALSEVESGAIEWVHIGTGSRKNELAAYCEEKLGQKEGIRYKFFGELSREEIYEFYRDTYVDVFVSVDLSDSVPTAIMEAMANRIMICAVDSDGVKDVLDEKTGLLLPKDIDAKRLGKILEGLCKVPKEKIQKKKEATFRQFQDKWDANVNCLAFCEAIGVFPEK